MPSAPTSRSRTRCRTSGRRCIDASHRRGRPQAQRRASQILARRREACLLLEAGTHHGSPLAFAQDDDDSTDSSGRRSGPRSRGGDDHEQAADAARKPRKSRRGRRRRRGREAAVGIAEIRGSLEVRIVGDDAGDFVPGELTVDVGQSVTFVNIHSDEHTATGSGFDTGIIPDEGGTATVVLDTPGVFPYACLIHPEMTGVIRVRDENGVVPETQTAAQEVPADATTVVIANLAFDPSAITVPTGTTVAWTNDDAVPHTVTSTDGAFDSGIFDPGGSFSFTFNEPGSFAYICQLHPQMQGTVTAEGEPVAGGTQAAQPTAARRRPLRQPTHPRQPRFRRIRLDRRLRVRTGDACRSRLARPSSGRTTASPRTPSPEISPTQAFSNLARPSRTRFRDRGGFSYVCAIHPQMTGTIRVSAAEPSRPRRSHPPVGRRGPEGVWLIELDPRRRGDSRRAPGSGHLSRRRHARSRFFRGARQRRSRPPSRSGRGEWVVHETDLEHLSHRAHERRKSALRRHGNIRRRRPSSTRTVAPSTGHSISRWSRRRRADRRWFRDASRRIGFTRSVASTRRAHGLAAPRDRGPVGSNHGSE